MTIQTPTDYIAARAFVACYGPHWSPEIEAIIGKRMAEDVARVHGTPDNARPKNKSEVARQMARNGATQAQVAKALGLKSGTVSVLFKEAGVTGPGPAARGAIAREMIAKGATRDEVIAATGLTYKTVTRLFYEAGRPVSRPKDPASIKAAAMGEAGATAKEIAAATGLSERTARKYCKVKNPVGGSRPTPGGARGREMAARGATVDEIVAETDLSRSTAEKLVRAARKAAV